MPILGVVNQKGGVGKTTTAVNVAAGLHKRGKSVLLIDCDPQGNASTALGIRKNDPSHSLKALFEAAVTSEIPDSGFEEFVQTTEEGVDIISASSELAGIDAVLSQAVGKEFLLTEPIQALAKKYEWILFDAPPSLGLLTINILTACDGLIVPLQSEFFAMEGISQLLKTIQAVQKRMNSRLKIWKIVITMHDGRSKSAQQVTSELKQYFGDLVSNVTVPRNIRLSESPSFGRSAISLFPHSKGAKAYEEFVEELLQ